MKDNDDVEDFQQKGQQLQDMTGKKLDKLLMEIQLQLQLQ